MKKKQFKGRSITPKHVEAYISGVYKTLYKGIKEDPELSLEIRRKNEAIVYYQKDKILTTSFDAKDNPKVTMLDRKYYAGKDKPSIDIENISNLRSLSKIRDYFKAAKRLAHPFMGEEFAFQQNIAMGNHSFDKKYIVIDMEWQFAQEEIEETQRISTRTRIDLVVIDTEKNTNGFNDIYLAELKVGTGATEGKSGIIDHVNKTFEIIQKKEACSSLIQDVTSILANKTALGIISGQPKEFHFAEKPKMMIISAYRGEIEKQKLENEVQKAKKRAKEIGMEEPKCLLYNANILLTEHNEH